MFSIVTPSLRQFDWLRRCVRSIEDQGVAYEHIVQDAGTGPELDEWVRTRPHTKLFVEKDGGVYDALNRGFARAQGDLFAFLHCDEQYLPGTLRKVEQTFAAEPGLDLVIGDYLVVDADARLLSFHRATPLRRSVVLTDHLYDYTCAMFFRRPLWEQSGGFNTAFKMLADADWISRILTTRPRMKLLGEFTSAFGITGENLSLSPIAREEERRLRASAPAWARAAAPVLRQFRHLEKLLRGGYASRPIDYALYQGDNPQRTAFRAERPSFRHPWR
jgi:glycosyltransferase involved in cell wall biosynthesis